MFAENSKLQEGGKESADFKVAGFSLNDLVGASLRAGSRCSCGVDSLCCCEGEVRDAWARLRSERPG